MNPLWGLLTVLSLVGGSDKPVKGRKKKPWLAESTSEESVSLESGKMTSREKRAVQRESAKDSAKPATAKSVKKREKRAKIASLPAASTSAKSGDLIPSNGATQKYKELSSATTAFALNFFRVASADHINFVCAPISMGFGLAMLVEGATGETRDEIYRTLGIDASPESVRRFYSGISASLNTGYVRSLVANGLFHRKEIQIKRPFIDCLTGNFDATVRSLDFDRGTKCAEEINSWMDKKTKGILGGVISDRDFGAATICFLVNTLYFEAKWEEFFKNHHTMLDKFHGSLGDRMELFMKGKFYRVRFSCTDDVTVVSMPYVGGDAYSFVVLMPKGEFDEWKKNLTAEMMNDSIEKCEEGDSKVFLPKFDISSDLDGRKTLMTMGVTKIFDGIKAELDGITNEDGFHVNDILQKSRIMVDEKGTMAAAATRYSSEPIGCDEPTEIHFDHPFIFAIMKGRLPVFIGQYV